MVWRWLKARRDLKKYNQRVELARHWESALPYLHHPHSLFYITGVRQNAKRGQKVWLQQAKPTGPQSWSMKEPEAGWIWHRHFTPRTWIGIALPGEGTYRTGAASNRGHGEHHNESVFYIDSVLFAVSDRSRAAWQHLQDHHSP